MKLTRSYDNMPFRKYESLTQAAARTGLSVQSLRQSIAAGELKAYRSGHRILRVDPLDVDLLKCQTQMRRGATSVVGLA